MLETIVVGCVRKTKEELAVRTPAAKLRPLPTRLAPPHKGSEPPGWRVSRHLDPNHHGAPAPHVPPRRCPGSQRSAASAAGPACPWGMCVPAAPESLLTPEQPSVMRAGFVRLSFGH